AVNQHHRLGYSLEVDRPVERGVAAADEKHALILELSRVENLEVESPLLVFLLSLHPELPSLESPDAGRDNDGPSRIDVVTRLEEEVTCVAALDPAKPGDYLTQMGGGAELQSLRRHVPHQVLGQNLREAGDIEDVFLRI